MAGLRKKTSQDLKEWVEDASQLRKIRAAAVFYIQDLFNLEQREPSFYAKEFDVPVRKLNRFLNDPNGMRSLIQEAEGDHIASTLSKIFSDFSKEIFDEESEMSVRERIEMATFLSKYRGGSFEKGQEGLQPGLNISISLPASLQGSPEEVKPIEARLVEEAEQKIKRIVD